MSRTVTEHPLSWNAIFRVVLTIVIFYLFYRLYIPILIIIISCMLAAALYPYVKYLHRKKVPLALAAAIVMLVILTPLILICAIILPPLYSQYPSIIQAVNDALKTSDALPEAVRDINISQYSSNIGHYLLSSTTIITNFITNFLTVVFLSIYLLIDARRLKELLIAIVPSDQEERVEKLLHDLIAINGQYIRGNIFISIICGITTYICLKVLGIPFAAPLALFSAIFDLLPIIGAFIGAAPAILIGFSISPITGILVLMVYIVYQQVENNIISPLVYDKSLDISPAVSFIAFIFGTSLLGIIGAFLSLPIAAGIPTIIKYARGYKKESG